MSLPYKYNTRMILPSLSPIFFSSSLQITNFERVSKRRFFCIFIQLMVIRMSSGQGTSSTAADQAANDNKANQCNANHDQYAGHQPGYSGTGDQADLNNHGNQLNPNNANFQPKGSK